MIALVTEWGLGLVAIICTAAAPFAYAYVPLVGRYLCAGLLIAAAGLTAYDLGYAARGRLDISQALQKQLDWANEELAATKAVQEAANSRAREAEQQSVNLQEQINAYEASLKSRPAEPACAMSGDDVRTLERLRDNSTGGRHPAASRPTR